MLSFSAIGTPQSGPPEPSSSFFWASSAHDKVFSGSTVRKQPRSGSRRDISSRWVCATSRAETSRSRSLRESSAAERRVSILILDNGGHHEQTGLRYGRVPH